MLTNENDLLPADAGRPLHDERVADGGADDSVRGAHGQLERGGDEQQHGAGCNHWCD